MRHYISLGLIILLSSCALTKNYYPQTVQSWQGGNAHNLINQWGQPDELVTKNNGNALLVYKSSSYRLRAAQGAPISAAPCITTFEINKSRTIVDANYSGNRCFGDASFADYKSNHVKGSKK